MYGEDDNQFGGDLYDSSGFPDSAPQPEPVVPAPAAGSANPPSSPESQAFSKSLQVITNPASLVMDAVDPSQTKLPMGVAILGACIVAMLWANSMSKGK